MSSIYEEVEIEDMTFSLAEGIYSYPCPCGDRFVIHIEDLLDGEDIASCPSCTLRIRVIFDEDSLPHWEPPADCGKDDESIIVEPQDKTQPSVSV